MTTTTASHITRSTGYGGTSEADCTLCGAHASSHGMWADDDIQAWIDDHATQCTPDTVRVKAAHLREAARLLADYIDTDPADGTDWDHPVVLAAAGSLRAHLYDTAQRLETAAHDAENPAPAGGSGSCGPRADGGVR